MLDSMFFQINQQNKNNKYIGVHAAITKIAEN